MTDVQMTGRVQAKREKVITGYYDFVQMRPGRFVTCYDRWPAEACLSEHERVLSIGQAATSNFGGLADWLVSGTRPYPRPERPEPAVPIENVEPELRQLVGHVLDEWQAASAHQSSMRRAAKHPYFELIRKMGPLAVEMIVERLDADPNPLWIWALGELTGEDPARGASTIPEAGQAWLQWAHQRSLD